MTQAFKKVACLTDIHFGLKSNSETHNKDCLDYIEWFIQEAKDFGAETSIFLGDWHHNRNTLQVNTLHYSMRGMQMLSENFEQNYHIVGNHDMFFRDNRSITSTEYSNYMFDNIHYIDRPLDIGEVRFQPWIVGDEWEEMKDLEARYVFGHFELPGFMMNAKFAYPDHGKLNGKHFANQEYVFSGHFHARQIQGHIHYIGNCFGHNFADAMDFDRGAMFLEYGGEPVYKNWDEAPRYVAGSLSDVLQTPEVFTNKTYARLTVDGDLSYEEQQVVRDDLTKEYGLRELELRPMESNAVEGDDATTDIQFQTVDQLVVESLKTVDSATVQPDRLIEIYLNLGQDAA